MSLPSLNPANSPLRYISRTFSGEQAHLLASVSGEYGRSATSPSLGIVGEGADTSKQIVARRSVDVVCEGPS